MTDRLDRIENILATLAEDLKATRAIADSNARAIEANANETALLKEAERSLFTSQQQLTVVMIGLADTVSQCNQRMDRTQAEIRGLRVETRRILERWLGEPFTDDPDLDDEEDTPT